MKKDIFNRKKIATSKELEIYLEESIPSIFNAYYKNGEMIFFNGEKYKLEITPVKTRQILQKQA